MCARGGGSGYLGRNANSAIQSCHRGIVSEVPSLLFFVSSCRRHTRWTGDWSSDVCASDLHYPEELQHRGIQGRVMVQLIIDTLGHAEPASIQFLTSPNVEFEQPVRDYLVFARFRPAQIGRASCREGAGRVVRGEGVAGIEA